MPFQTPASMQQHPQQAVFSNQQYSQQQQQQQQLMQRQSQMDPKYLNNPANQVAQGSLPVATPPPAPPPLTIQQQQQATGHLQRPQLVQTPPIQQQQQQQQQFSVPQQPITPLRFNNKVQQHNPTAAAAAINPGLHVQQQQQQHAAHVQSKRERLFPPSSIEASVPNESKKRKITHKEITPCDPWKLFMCLKSGLLAESTWALDALNIFLYDDNTIGYFHLKHFPGLVNILLEYYVKCLQSIFADDFGCLPHKKDHNNTDTISQVTTTGDRSSSCKSNSTTDDHVMKTHRVVFNDKESTKFFNVHRKVSKLADKAIFVKKIRTPDDVTHTSKYNCQQLKDLVVDATTDDATTTPTDICYYRTSFSKDDELTKTERLFYGPYYEQRCQMSMDKQKTNKTKDNHKTDDNDDDHETNKKRKCQSNYEDQADIDEDSLFTILSQKQDELMNRCMCISTILRNLSFVPGNDVELCKSALFVDVLSNLLLFKHKHNRKRTTTMEHSYDNGECQSNNVQDQQQWTTSNHVNVLNDWWWDGVHILRENTLVTLTNLAAILNLNNYNEAIIKRILNGLIHWSTCRSSDALDTLVTVSDTSCISPQRLCIETLSKMTVNDINVDLLLACATNDELDALFAVLGDWLVRRDEETLREFAIVLLTSVAKCDQLAARLISKYSSLLIAYLEDFEEQARILFLSSHHHHHHSHHHHQQQHPQQFLSDDNLGTTADMLRRCANCLLSIAAIPDNLQVLLKHEHRMLDLITSQYVDSIVGQKLAEVLYCCSHESKQRPTQARQQQQQRVLIA
jgi:AT-rich interactive domain-containing protein 1